MQPLDLISPTLPTKQVDDKIFFSPEDLLSSLPRQDGIFQPYSYQYQGFWFDPSGLQEIMGCQKHFQARENDIFLVTAPKSGTTWLKAVLYALINREACHPQDPHHPLLKQTPHQLVPFLESLMPSEYDSVSNSSDNSCTRIFGSHIPISSLPKSIMEEGKIVYLCRDIKDTFVSLFHFANKANFRPSPISLDNAFDLFCKGSSHAGPIWDQILGYWKESLERPHKVLFMRYEDMTDAPHTQLRRLAHFLGKPVSKEEENAGLPDRIIKLCSFGSMSNLEVNKTGNFVATIKNDSYFRSGVVGDWKKYLTAEMGSKLDQLTKEKFGGSGLSIS
ncbi:Sulfotransferase [Heracleum sosnowskyi]|uniref:Sulfotransferase n=1 Tax=Heracleum sosnowskyi TaxID=360622 RepID=A0AAD8MUB4_9APIA|nr:Sulfotransferase [Heracleum sosnowskyi]